MLPLLTLHSNELNLECARTALETACEKNSPKIVRQLLKQYKTMDGDVIIRAMHLAVRHGLLEVVRVLVDELEMRNYDRDDVLRLRKRKFEHVHLHQLPRPGFQSTWIHALVLVQDFFGELSKDSFTYFGLIPIVMSKPISIEVSAVEVAELIHPENKKLIELLGGGNSGHRIHSNSEENMKLNCTGKLLMYLLVIVAMPFILLEIVLIMIVSYAVFGAGFWYLFPFFPWWSKVLWYQIWSGLILLITTGLTVEALVKIGIKEKCCTLLNHACCLHMSAICKTRMLSLLEKLFKTEMHLLVLVVCILPKIFFSCSRYYTQ